MNLLSPRLAFRYYLPLAILGVAGVALLPGDENARPAAKAVVATAARPSFIVEVRQPAADNVQTAGIASLSVAPAPTLSLTQPLPDALTTAAIGSAEASEFPMDRVPEEGVALAVDPALRAGPANATIASAVNMRAGPSTSTQTLMVLKAGEPVSVIETNNGWVNVALADGRSGWVYSRYIAGAGVSADGGGVAPRVVDPDEASAEPVRTRGLRLAGDVALRAGPASSAQRLFRVDEGEQVTIAEERGEWVRIAIGSGPTGWVRKSDLAR